MTHRFGSTEYYLKGPTPLRSDLWGAEPTFRAREYFIDTMESEAPEACADFRQRVAPFFEELSEAWPNAPEGLPEALATLNALASRHHAEWTWPPTSMQLASFVVEGAPAETGSIPVDFQPTGPSPYGEAFGHFPPPSPWENKPTSGVEALLLIPAWWQCWHFLGHFLTALLPDQLDAWSAQWHLAEGENAWVASHLLARRCKQHLLPELDAHLPFLEPANHPHEPVGDFRKVLESVLESSSSWRPTLEPWNDWKKETEKRIRRALRDYRKRVLEEVEKTPERISDRDFRRLVRFQLLEEKQADLRWKGEDVKTVRAAIRRTAELVGLKRRTT